MRLLAVVLLVVLTACGGGAANTPTAKATRAPKTYDVSGSMSVSAVGNEVLADNGRKGSQCYGQNGFDDIQEGAQVVVRDDKGETVGVADLGPGVMATGLYVSNAHCDFAFTVPDVDSTSDFLSIEVAHRGQVQFKRKDAGAVSLTLSNGG